MPPPNGRRYLVHTFFGREAPVDWEPPPPHSYFPEPSHTTEWVSVTLQTASLHDDSAFQELTYRVGNTRHPATFVVYQDGAIIGRILIDGREPGEIEMFAQTEEEIALGRLVGMDDCESPRSVLQHSLSTIKFLLEYKGWPIGRQVECAYPSGTARATEPN